ncbi:uncharacterized protein LOC129033509 isoform X3 [Pongo pygmaeus]|uniref:uncharacterized protein LOC129033509 isoform X3 n=1 Tax=Pongo pygmaeus TaxID=9600 RepID=UPI00300D96B8
MPTLPAGPTALARPKELAGGNCRAGAADILAGIISGRRDGGDGPVFHIPAVVSINVSHGKSPCVQKPKGRLSCLHLSLVTCGHEAVVKLEKSKRMREMRCIGVSAGARLSAHQNGDFCLLLPLVCFGFRNRPSMQWGLSECALKE